MKLTIEQAYELCVLKWKYIVENNGSDGGLIYNFPILDGLRADCAYCELFVSEDGEKQCVGCPLNIIKDSPRRMNCNDYRHPYSLWDDFPTSEKAQKVLDLIKSTKP